MTTLKSVAEVKVWDAPVRLIHWGLVLSLITLFVSVNAGWMRLHFYAGYTLSALLVFRLLWAVWGTTYARFSGFHFSLRGLKQQVMAMARGEPLPSVGHNPAGSVMVVVLLVVLALQVVSGLMFSDDVFWYGPLNARAPEWLLNLAETLHPSLPPLILALVATHVLAVLYHQFRMKEPLIGSMIHGRKPVEGAGVERSEISLIWLGLSAIAAAFWLVWLFSLPL